MKIVFVFFVASSFKQSMAFKDIVVTTALAAFHVLIFGCVKGSWSCTDYICSVLGYAVCGNQTALYVLAGLGAGSVASVGLITCLITLGTAWSPGKIRLLHIAEADIR